MHDDDDDTAARLRAAIGRSDRLLSREAVSTGLTRTQLSILGAVSRAKSLSIGDLVEREGINPTMLSRIVGTLAAAGLVRRVPHPVDRRQALVEVTAHGSRRHRALQRQRTAMITDYLAGLPAADARKLRDALPVLEGLADHLFAQPHSTADATSYGATR